MKLRKGDNVIVITGKDKGKTGVIEAVLPRENRVVVAGVNIVKRSVKARQGLTQSGLVESPAPLNASNVMIVDPKKGGRTRVGYKQATGKKGKVRVARKSGTELTGASA